jgi:hypothetical protein
VPSALDELTSIGNKPSKVTTQFDRLRVDVGAKWYNSHDMLS